MPPAPTRGRQYAGIGALFCGLAAALGLTVSCSIDSWETLRLNADNISGNTSANVALQTVISTDNYLVVGYSAADKRNESATSVGVPRKIQGGLWASCDDVDDYITKKLEKSGISWWVQGHCMYDENLTSPTDTQATRQTATRTAQACLVVAAICLAVALLLELFNLFFLHTIASILAATTSFCTGVYVAFSLALVCVRMDHPEHFTFNELSIDTASMVSRPASSTWIAVVTLVLSFLSAVSSTAHSRYLRDDMPARGRGVCVPCRGKK